MIAADWNKVERYADALAVYTREEPLPLTDFIITRGRTLAAHGQGGSTIEIRAELRSLRDEAVRAGLLAAVPAIEQALG